MVEKAIFVLVNGGHRAELYSDVLGWVLYLDDVPRGKFAVRKGAITDAFERAKLLLGIDDDSLQWSKSDYSPEEYEEKLMNGYFKKNR